MSISPKVNGEFPLLPPPPPPAWLTPPVAGCNGDACAAAVPILSRCNGGRPRPDAIFWEGQEETAV